MIASEKWFRWATAFAVIGLLVSVLAENGNDWIRIGASMVAGLAYILTMISAVMWGLYTVLDCVKDRYKAE